MSPLRVLNPILTALSGTSSRILVLVSFCWLAGGQVCAEEAEMPHQNVNDSVTQEGNSGSGALTEELVVEQVATQQPILNDAQSETTHKASPTRYGVGYEYRMSRMQRPQRAQRPERPNRPQRPGR